MGNQRLGAATGRQPWRMRILTVCAVYFTFLGGTYITDLQLWPRIIHHYFVGALILVWLIGLLRSGKGFPLTALDAPLLLFFVVQILSTVFSMDFRFSLEWLWQSTLHVFLFYILVDLARTYRYASLLEPIAFAASLVVIVGLAEILCWYFGIPIIPSFRQGWPEIGGLTNLIPPVLRRLTFTLYVSTSLAAYLAIFTPFFLAWLIASKRRDTRIGLGIWLVAAQIVQWLSFSRGGLLSLAVSLPTFLMLLWVGNRDMQIDLRRWLADWRVLAGIGVSLLFTGLIIALWINRLAGIEGAGHIAGDRVRLDLWRSAIIIALENPILGIGLGKYAHALRSVRNPELVGDDLISANNIILFTFAESGVLGVASFVLLCMALIIAAFRQWKAAEGAKRIRIAGTIAALLGFGCHNMVDNFTSTNLVLPLLIMTTYLVYEHVPRRTLPDKVISHYIPIASVLIIVSGLIGWVFSDIAQFRFVRGLESAQRGRFDQAILDMAVAERLDPGMGLYPIQKAQYLGQEVLLDKDGSLETALIAYEEALTIEDTHDVIRANHAALLREAGQLDGAFDQMAEAARIKPKEARYFLWAGELAEQAGQPQTAAAYYSEALNRYPAWATSTYWMSTELRQSLRSDYLKNAGLATILLDTLDRVPYYCWAYLPDSNASEDSVPLAGYQAGCEGMVSLYVEEDPNEAILHLSEAIEASPSISEYYVARAEAYFELNELSQAERDAKTAIFLGNDTGSYILGLMAEAQGDIALASKYYEIGGPVRFVSQGWSVAVYGRFADFQLYPAFDAPLFSRYDFRSWLALANLYDRQGDNLRSQQVMSAILEINPFLAPSSE